MIRHHVYYVLFDKNCVQTSIHLFMIYKFAHDTYPICLYIDLHNDPCLYKKYCWSNYKSLKDVTKVELGINWFNYTSPFTWSWSALFNMVHNKGHFYKTSSKLLEWFYRICHSTIFEQNSRFCEIFLKQILILHNDV